MAAIVKTVNGLALASVKNVGGLAAASLKTINGQDASTPSLMTFHDDFEGQVSSSSIRTGWISGPGAQNDTTFRTDGKTEGAGSNSGAVVDPALHAFAANQEAEVTFDSYNANGPSVRNQPGTSEGYIASVQSTTRIIIQKQDNANGRTDLLDINPLPGSYSLAPGDHVVLKIVGTTLEVLVGASHPPTTSMGTVVDSTYPTGQPGIFANSYGGFTEFWATDI